MCKKNQKRASPRRGEFSIFSITNKGTVQKKKIKNVTRTRGARKAPADGRASRVHVTVLILAFFYRSWTSFWHERAS